MRGKQCPQAFVYGTSVDPSHLPARRPRLEFSQASSSMSKSSDAPGGIFGGAPPSPYALSAEHVITARSPLRIVKTPLSQPAMTSPTPAVKLRARQRQPRFASSPVEQGISFPADQMHASPEGLPALAGRVEELPRARQLHPPNPSPALASKTRRTTRITTSMRSDKQTRGKR